MLHKLFILISISLYGFAAHASDYSDEPYAMVLAKVVTDDGFVDYALLEQEKASLDEYLAIVAAMDPKKVAAWPEADRIAFFMNAYNAYTLKAIIERYPIEDQPRGSWFHPRNSIRQIPGVWDTLTWKVMGREMTLDDIEHGTLRKEYNEPRIHAALVCAAMSCPPLRNEPYRGKDLDAQLGDQMKRWLASSKNIIDPAKKRVEVSKIFDWYGKDFKDTSGLIPNVAEEYRGFIAAMVPYVSKEQAAFLKAGGYRVRFMSYDWTLNNQPKGK